MSPLSGIAAGALGAVVGGVAVALFGQQLVRSGRPAAKTALKAALLGLYAAQVRGAEIVEAMEDLYAEAKSELTAEIIAAAVAAAQEKAATAPPGPAAAAGEGVSAAQPARQRAAVKRSRVVRTARPRHG